jgi:hypothetical protein
MYKALIHPEIQVIITRRFRRQTYISKSQKKMAGIFVKE